MGAIKSAYDNDPWEPTVYTGSDQSDQQSAAAQYTQIYGGSVTTQSGSPPSGGSNPKSAKVPTLSAAYTQAPDIIPNSPGDSGGSSSTNSAELWEAIPSYIELPALRSAEQTFLNSASTLMEAYQTLKSVVNNAIDSPNTWGQEVGVPISPADQSTWAAHHGAVDPLDSEGQAMADSTNPQMQQALVASAGAIEAIGMFNALLNNAGQMYGYTDQQSSFAFTNPPSSSGSGS
jgi:hypothetical protein